MPTPLFLPRRAPEAPGASPPRPFAHAAARGREAAALLLGATSIFVALALASFEANPANPEAHGPNWVGPVGASLAGTLVGAVGVIAWTLVLELALLAWPLLRARPSKGTLARLAGDMLIVLIAASLVHVAAPDARAFGALAAGGSLGELFGELLRSLFSTVGSFLVGLTAVGLILIGRSSLSLSAWLEEARRFVTRAARVLVTYARALSALVRRWVTAPAEVGVMATEPAGASFDHDPPTWAREGSWGNDAATPPAGKAASADQDAQALPPAVAPVESSPPRRSRARGRAEQPDAQPAPTVVAAVPHLKNAPRSALSTPSSVEGEPRAAAEERPAPVIHSGEGVAPGPSAKPGSTLPSFGLTPRAPKAAILSRDPSEPTPETPTADPPAPLRRQTAPEAQASNPARPGPKKADKVAPFDKKADLSFQDDIDSPVALPEQASSPAARVEPGFLTTQTPEPSQIAPLRRRPEATFAAAGPRPNAAPAEEGGAKAGAGPLGAGARAGAAAADLKAKQAASLADSKEKQAATFADVEAKGGAAFIGAEPKRGVTFVDAEPKRGVTFVSPEAKGRAGGSDAEAKGRAGGSDADQKAGARAAEPGQRAKASASADSEQRAAAFFDDEDEPQSPPSIVNRPSRGEGAARRSSRGRTDESARTSEGREGPARFSRVESEADDAFDDFDDASDDLPRSAATTRAVAERRPAPEPRAAESRAPEAKAHEAKAPEARAVEIRAESRAIEARAEARPVEAKAEARPVEAKIIEARPAEAKIIEARPHEAKAPEAKAQPAKAPERVVVVPAWGQGFRLPSTSLLEPAAESTPREEPEALLSRARELEKVLANYGVKGTVADIHTGPTVSTFEVVPAEGTKVSKVASLDDDLALGLSCTVRIIAPIPGKSRIGFELPNRERIPVNLRELVEDRRFREMSAPLPVVLGRDIVGAPYYADLASMPHVIVAGATGAGKSVGLNVMLTSLLTRRGPDELRMLMIDPKVVELAPFDRIPHMLLPVVTDMKQAATALKWAVDEMERRYQLFANAGTKNIGTYNAWVGKARRGEIKAYRPSQSVSMTTDDGTLVEVGPGREPPPLPEPLPFIVIVVDEFADLMMQQGKDVEAAVARLAQKARAAGMHVILATQRPSVDVITGMIKANFPTRVAFRVAQRVDSRTILDEQGAEHLLGRGDMLVKLNGTNETRRVQCPFISEEEVQRVTDFLRAQGEPIYDENILKPRDDEEGGAASDDDGELDPKYDEAVRVVADTRRCSTSWLQRKLGLGYNRAAKIVEAMEKRGVVGPAHGARDREVLIDQV